MRAEHNAINESKLDSVIQHRTDLLSNLQQEISRVLSAFVTPGLRTIFWDFTEHPNVGDSLLLLGELKWLAENGPAVSFGTLSAPAFRNASTKSKATIFLHGGGNLGDLWPRHDELRCRVVKWARGRTVVVFPQSLALHRSDAESKAYLARTMKIFADHGDSHILVRDTESADRLSGYDVDIRLCPDMAFYLGQIPQTASSRNDPLVILQRSDIERPVGSKNPSERYKSTDWLDNHVLDRVLVQCGASLLSPPFNISPRSSTAARIYQLHALRRVLHGAKKLSAGRVIVSDRLHANIFAMLQGKPTVAVHDAYNKISRTLSTWFPSEALPPFVSNFQVGVELGVKLAEECREPSNTTSRKYLFDRLNDEISGWNGS